MTPETRTLHQILSAVIITGASRNDTAAQLKSQAEAAATALRAGLSAFTAPAEPLVGGQTNASIPVTVNYGGAKEDAIQHSATGGRLHPVVDAHISRVVQKNVESMTRLAAMKRMVDAAACGQDHGLADWALLLIQADAAPIKTAHSAACAPAANVAQCGCRTAPPVQAAGVTATPARRGLSNVL